VATRLDVTQAFPADPTTVLAMLADPDYIVLRGERTGATSVSASVEPAADGGLEITVERVLPADVPSYAKSMIGDAITVTETYHWNAPAADGSTTGTMDARFSAPITCSATMTLRPDGDGTAVVTTGEFKASIPFVGGKIEDLARKQIERYLHKEQAIAAEWLAR